MVNDVEKRWNDPPTLRRAARYVLAVIVLTGIAMAVALVWAAARPQCLDAENMRCDTVSRLVVGLGPGLMLLFGGIGAFVITYRQWRDGKPWPIWQGAGWFLFTLMVVYLSLAGASG
ncbi:hypothetical protein JK358_07060 [Nocardia sp. 2]|uniref:DUF2530 domain-containing protein n=1 Tax=Nocardia acididurans TaxID=2802282 RepID=A0ABS1M0G4_9NOCA|nr:hypothetical protein [Nocardia acididurans]MBL1074152.1 hypothetical protein [Nocardia acididurans]